MLYTVCQKKQDTWFFIITLANMNRFSKFSLPYSYEHSLNILHKDIHNTLIMLPHYRGKFEKSKMILNHKQCQSWVLWIRASRWTENTTEMCCCRRNCCLRSVKCPGISLSVNKTVHPHTEHETFLCSLHWHVIHCVSKNKTLDFLS